MAIELSRAKKDETKFRKADRPSRVEKITSALIEMEESDTISDCAIETPGAFLWEFYKAWVTNGGQDGGKNRNSIRRMRDVWLIGNNDVKSLHPKLTGRVRVSKDDAKSLMSLFLGRWEFVGTKEGDWGLTPDGYAPFPCRDRKKLCDRFADAMYPAGSAQARSGLLLPVRPGEDQLPAAETDWHDFIQRYGDVDALITLSRHKASIGRTPAETIRLFWNFMNGLYETVGDKDIIFIWIVDIGVRQVEDANAWKDFLNFEMLKTQFRAFASFDSEIDAEEADEASDGQPSAGQSGIHAAFLRSITIPEEGHREKRWKWLCDRTAIIIQNLRKEEFEHLYADEDEHADKFRLRDIGVTAETILPSMIPSRWSHLKELRDLYGRDRSDISDATLTVLFNRKGYSGDRGSVRYIAHALNPKLGNDTPEGLEATSRELPSPGSHYVEAMGLAYWAARHRLKKFRGDEDDADQEDWEIAVAYLANQGFRVIRLQEFMGIHRSPGD